MRRCSLKRISQSLRSLSQVPSLSKDHLLQLVELCCERKILSEALQLHSQVEKNEIPQDGLIGASLVRMYIKCGSLSNARKVFDHMADRQSMVLWTCMVTAYVDNGDFQKAWVFFSLMQLEGVLPDRVTFITILNACSCRERGSFIHSLIVEKGVESNVTVGNALVKMYGKCSDIEVAAKFFEKMPRKDVISWTGMVSAYAQCGQYKEGLGYYFRMNLEGVLPNNITFLAVLGACMTLAEGRLVYSNIVEAQWDSDTMVANALINMFSKCGSLEDARLIFQGMKHWNTTSWNAMIGACTQHGFSSEALELFNNMQRQSSSSRAVIPNKISFVSVLGACDSPDSLPHARVLHESIVQNGFESDVVLGTALVNAYCRCGNLVDARSAFDRIHEKNVVSWNTMISAYSREESERACAVELFQRMLLQGVKPTRTTALSVLNSVDNLELAKQLHFWVMTSGLYSDLYIGSALVNMFERAGSLEDARKAFEVIVERDVFAWNAIVGVCIKQERCFEALEQFGKMQLEGTAANRASFLLILDCFSSPGDITRAREVHSLMHEAGFEADTNVGNAVISMYTRSRSLDDCRRMFNKMEEKSVVTWTSIIAACKELGSCKEAIQLFQIMDLEPDKVTLTIVLEACIEISARDEGKMVHARVVEQGLETDLYVACTLIHMYSGIGSMEDAAEVFGKLEMPNLACWNSLLGGYAQNGHTKEVIELFRAMQLCGMQPDHISFLGLVSACSHAGDLEQGVRYFASMSGDFGVDPVVEDYGCLIDLLARAGQLSEAYEFLRKMPIKPSDVTWKSLVAACKVQGDTKRGRSAAHKVLQEEPDNAAAYVELYNMCSMVS